MSVLCRMSGDEIFKATGKPMSPANRTASAALLANPAWGV